MLKSRKLKTISVLLLTLIIMILCMTTLYKIITSIQNDTANYIQSQMIHTKKHIENTCHTMSYATVDLALTLSNQDQPDYHNELKEVVESTICSGGFIFLSQNDDIPLYYMRKNSIVPDFNQESIYLNINTSLYKDYISMIKDKNLKDIKSLYYWTNIYEIDNEQVRLVIAPIIYNDSIIGACGLELSDSMFQSLFTPVNNDLQCMVTTNTNPYHTIMTTGDKDESLYEIKPKYSLTKYEGSKSYIGIHEPLQLYDHTNFLEETLILVMLESRFTLSYVQNVGLLIFILLLLFIGIIVLIYHIVKRYIKPLYDEIQKLYVDKKEKEKKIIELATKEEDVSKEEYEYFVQNIHTLTTTEHRIFKYYVEGKKSKDILELLEIKENTLKYHNRNIYSKLGINSRKQLITYGKIYMQSKRCQ